MHFRRPCCCHASMHACWPQTYMQSPANQLIRRISLFLVGFHIHNRWFYRYFFHQQYGWTISKFAEWRCGWMWIPSYMTGFQVCFRDPRWCRIGPPWTVVMIIIHLFWLFHWWAIHHLPMNFCFQETIKDQWSRQAKVKLTWFVIHWWWLVVTSLSELVVQSTKHTYHWYRLSTMN